MGAKSQSQLDNDNNLVELLLCMRDAPCPLGTPHPCVLTQVFVVPQEDATFKK